MTLKELYDKMPVAQHDNILVDGNRVYVRSSEGTDEYVLHSVKDGELALVRSDKANPMAGIRQDVADLKRDLAAIKAKLGI